MKKNNKGFTLAELLIVVAIIAVLVAIAIPVFTTQLEKSKEGTDIANLRSAYAAGQVAALSGQMPDGTDLPASCYYNPNKDGSLDSQGVAIGQGTATDGKSDVSAITGGIIKYSKGDVKGQKIQIVFESGVVKTVAFENEVG